MKEYTENARRDVQLPVCDRTVTTDLSGEFSLPDYQPEIKRLLRIGASVLPPVRYAAGDNVEMGGSMDYFVLYMGNDNRLYCAPLATDYRFAVPTEGGTSIADGEMVSTCDIVPEMITGRVLAPRRMNIKCRLRSHVKAYRDGSVGFDMSEGLSPASVETLSDTVEACRLYQRVGEMMPLADDMILSPSDGEMRVVCAEGQVMVNEVAAGNDMVNCRGEVMLKLTLCPMDRVIDVAVMERAGDGGGYGEQVPPAPVEPVVVTRRIPFAQAIDVPGVTPACDACAHGTCSELAVEVEEGRLHTDLGVVLEVLAQKNEPVAYVKDMYSTRKEMSCRYEDHAVERAMKCINGNFTLSDSLTLAEAGIDPACRVIDAVATPYAEALAVDRGRGVLTGRCRCHLLLTKDGEYTSAEIELPFRYETDAAVEGVEPDFDGSVKAVTCRARMDGERVGIDAELAVMLRLVSDGQIRTLGDVSFGTDVTRRRGEYVICFPSPDDTLWSVAKRYHAPLATLSAANQLSTTDVESTLHGVGYLIV